MSRYYQLKADTSSAQSFTLLKNFFTYVDDLEYHVFNKRIEKGEFKEAVEKITGLKITDRESEYLFKVVKLLITSAQPSLPSVHALFLRLI